MTISKSDFNRIYMEQLTPDERERMEIRRIEGGFASVYEMFSAAEKYERSIGANWWKILIVSFFVVSAIMSL